MGKIGFKDFFDKKIEKQKFEQVDDFGWGVTKARLIYQKVFFSFSLFLRRIVFFKGLFRFG